jgi:hypothetical protein
MPQGTHLTTRRETMDTQRIVTPIIHPNGDRQEALISTMKRAYVAIKDAQKALRETAPHGRNFYPEEGRMQRAEEQYRRRQEALQSVMDSLVAECNQMRDENP